MRWTDFVPPLAVLAGGAALLLAVNLLTASPLHSAAARERQQTMERLLPGSRTFTPEPYDGEDDLIRTLHKGEGGYVAVVTVNGYADELTLWVGVDDGGRVTGLTVRDMAETWGLGRHAMDNSAFLSQFLGTSGHAAVGEDISALAGATVTSRAVARAVNAASAAVTGADLSAGATEWGGN